MEGQPKDTAGPRSQPERQAASSERSGHTSDLMPSITLPKGGGAIRGIDEKLAVNPLTGTAALNIPLPIAPGRSKFAPQLVLSYDSGAGNGAFGLGWQAPAPSISRKTDKGLPRYRDDEESDVFILSGAEDLVPSLIKDTITGELKKETFPQGGFNVQCYRPRIEGLFARIEKWSASTTGETHWRSISKENITTVYGESLDARIADPDDDTRVFQWLIEESYDEKGNVILYRYKQEDGADVNKALPQERNRSAYANRYLKRIFYGNQTPRAPGAPHQQEDCHFEIVFDYGEHDAGDPSSLETGPWPTRRDPFSNHRAGFEIRTYRLCRRVLMFHHHFTELGPHDLVRATDFTYKENETASFVRSMTETGYEFDSTARLYNKKSLPPLEFTYTEARAGAEVKTIDAASLENLPVGMDGANYQWVDLDSEGLSGILTEQANAWFYKRNLGNGKLAPDEVISKLAPMQVLPEHPSLGSLGSGAQPFTSLANDGRLDLAQFAPPLSGYYERDEEDRWREFIPFKSIPNIDWRDPNLKFVDLTGDGHADLLISEHEVFVWYKSQAKAGFGEAEWVRKLQDEERNPALVFADTTQSVYLADMSGDGLTDIARIRNGEICYWPNMGYGRFGAKVTIDNAPWFDHPDQFNQSRIRLADIDGSGATDIVYLGRDAVRYWFNQSGNSFSATHQLASFPRTGNLSSVTVVDLLGNGTSCLVWSSPLPGDTRSPMRYVDLMSGMKPHLLSSIKNNVGAETRVQYAASTKFYLADRAAGTPWITRLPFPVHVVEKIESFDYVSKTKFVNTYSYRHGYYDGEEREFRGFGYVEQRDTESFSKFSGQGLFTEQPKIAGEEFHLPPVVTKTWFHTGAWFKREKISTQYTAEYFNGDAQAITLPDTVLESGLTTAQEEREACRALKGSILRQEVYAEDDSPQSAIPYSVSERNYTIRQIQPLGDNRYAVFFAHPSETIDYRYERDAADPRIGHGFTLEVDDYGNVLESAAVGYTRRTPAFPEQAQTLVTLTNNRVTNKPDEPDWYRIGVPVETRTYEITGASAQSGIFTLLEFTQALAAATEITYETKPTENTKEKRLIEHIRTIYLKDDLSAPLLLGEVESLGLTYESYKLAFTPGLLTQVYGTRVDDALMQTEAGYTHSENDINWWIPSGRLLFETQQTQRNPFLLPVAFRDPFGNVSSIGYDAYNLLVTETTDPPGNQVKADNDYRVLQPAMMTDPNLNRSAVRFDELGMVTAIAVMGKPGAGEGDTLDDPTTRMEYELFNWKRHAQPNFVHAFAREQHGAANPRWQESYSYSDGSGHEVMKKVQAEPGLAPARDAGSVRHTTGGDLIEEFTEHRWVGTGRTVVDNKNNPIKKYEPFFDSSPAFNDEQELVELGVTPILRYDPLSRLIRTDNPNGTFSRVEFDSWQQIGFDENDTVLESQWHAARQNLPTTDPERRAADKAAAHAHTPAFAYFDTLGRTFLTVAHNKFKRGNSPVNDPPVEECLATRVLFDIEGNERDVIDAKDRVVMRYDYDMLGNRIHQASMEAGERWMFNDVTGKPIRAWDSRGFIRRMTYDKLRRPTELFVTESGVERLAEQTVYGESLGDAGNHRTRVHKVFDGAGVVTSEAYDFKGNLLRGKRELLSTYKPAVDWRQHPLADDGTFVSSSAYDALNRPIQLIAPHSDQPGSNVNIIEPLYNEANLLEQQHVWLNQSAEPSGLLAVNTANLHAVANIDYNAKGQRVLIEYGNGARTTYDYDPLTFRLAKLTTTRPALPDSTASQIFKSETLVQDLRYTYDPVGNITRIEDAALKTIVYNQEKVEPVCEYIYDAVYRLIEATGREHIGQSAFDFDPPDRRDYPFVGLQAHPNDAQAMRNYTELYEYDKVGNFDVMSHIANGGGWNRKYEYEAASLLEPAAHKSNRLTKTTVGNGGPFPETYSYIDADGHDVHGCMTAINSMKMVWDFKDQLQKVDLGGGGKAYYVYDASGQRVRKVIETQNGTRKNERVYLGGFEVYREFNAGGANVTLERETLHVMDDKRRITLVETKTKDTSQPPPPNSQPLIRYQFGNHLGSHSLELDDQAQIVSYEEYSPYGNTSYQAVRSETEASKRYRYTGKERDEETGLCDYGARYYLPALGRWLSCDPIGLSDSISLYSFTRCSPISLTDMDGRQSEGNVINSISEKQKPRAVSNWWGEQQKNPSKWSHPLSEEERGYLQVFTSEDVPVEARVGRGIATAGNLTDEETEQAASLFGNSPEAASTFANYENRRRIIAHYVLIHPATIQYELELYRLTRDLIPPLFIAERIAQIIRGKESFTEAQASRIGAAVDLAIPIALGRVLSAAKSAATPLTHRITRELESPIYDLPSEGGGMQINGRWYTEHALERMAPDTPQVRAELEARAAARAEKMGLEPGSEAYAAVLANPKLKVDPRGVPPSVVETEIVRPGSTHLRVITANRGQVVITVKHR